MKGSEHPIALSNSHYPPSSRRRQTRYHLRLLFIDDALYNRSSNEHPAERIFFPPEELNIALEAISLTSPPIALDLECDATKQLLAALLRIEEDVREEDSPCARAEDGFAEGVDVGAQGLEEGRAGGEEGYGSGLAARDDQRICIIEVFLCADLERGYALRCAEAVESGFVFEECALEG
jgi:hypothetical protein